MSSEVGDDSSSETAQVYMDFASGAALSEMNLSGPEGLGSKNEDFHQQILEKESSERNDLYSSSASGVCKDLDVKDLDEKTLLENKKKRLLEEIEVTLLPRFKEVANTEEIKDAGRLTGDKGSDSSVAESLKMEVVDDTSMVEIPPLSEAGCSFRRDTDDVGLVEDAEKSDKRNGKEKVKNGCKDLATCANAEKNSKRSVRDETDSKKTRRSRRKGSGEKTTNEVKYRQENVCSIAELQRLSDGSKRMYSRKEMEALQCVNIIEQKKLWNRVYSGLEPVVSQEYNEIASVKHKNVNTTFNPVQHIKRNGFPAAVFGSGCCMGKMWYHLNIFVH